MLSDLRYLLDRVVEIEGTSTESDIREKARARQSFQDAEHARKMFDELERRGCIRRIPRERVPGPGRNPSPWIEAHPALRGPDFSDKRQFTPHTPNRSDKSEGGAGEYENYERLEREAIQAESGAPPTDLFAGFQAPCVNAG